MTTKRATSPKAAPRAGLYLRISDDRSGDELGVRRQEKLCRELAGNRGWEVVATYTDNDASAYAGKRRKGYEELLEDVRAGTIAAVVTYAADRLYRHPKDLERFVEVVETAGAAVATVADSTLDLSTEGGRMTARILGAVSRHESERKARRQRDKHTELAAAGKGRGGGTRPFGFNEDRVTIREDEAALIQEAAGKILVGQSLRSLEREWAARGIVSPTGGPWSKTSIRRMLARPRTAGLRAHRGVVVAEAMWPAIISREDHEALRSVFMAPERNRRNAPPRRKYLLTGGLARCGKCGASLVARPNERGARRYVCSKDHGGCGGCFIIAEPLEEFVSEAVLLAVSGPDFSKALRKARGGRESHAGAELATTERRLENLADAYSEGSIGLDAYQRATTKLEARIQDLRRAAASEATGAVARNLPSGTKALRAWWAEADVTARAEVVRLVVESVTIGSGAQGLNRFDPRRVGIRWLA
jgi:site-specific DNA recombinase